MPSERVQRTEGWERLGDFALVLAIGMVLGRCLMLETVRDAFAVVPGQEIVLRSPNAAVTVVLDWISYLPALLVCIRAIWDERFKVRGSLSVVILAVIGVLAVMSALWSADRYTAVVSASKFLPGALLMWAVAQLVRDWQTFRLICAAMGGLLAVLIVHSLIYVYSDVPEMRRMLEENRDQLLKDRGFAAGSFSAIQFERKMTSGELMGYSASPNTLAAVTVLLMMGLIGDVGQKLRCKAKAGAFILPVGLLGGAGWIIWKTQSMTAMATPVLGMALLAATWMMRGWISRHRKLMFGAAVGIALLGIAAVVAHGIYHDSLFQRSLTFRWQYWCGSFVMFVDHPWLGVGWDNFGLHYLQYRLPVAPEEIKDPHNFFVRFAVELGAIGLILAVGWVLLTAWEVSRKIVLTDDVPAKTRGIGRLMALVSIAIIIVVFAGLDLSQDPVAVAIEVMRRVMYGGLILGVGVALGAIDLQKLRENGLPAPLIAIALGVGLLLYLLHNMIDFAFFETGPFYLCMLAIGAMLGLKEEHGPGLGWVPRMGGLIILVLMTATGAVIVPVVISDSTAHSADMAVSRSHLLSAENSYKTAFDESGWLHNAEYLMAKARVALWAGKVERAEDSYRDAIVANSRLIAAHLRLADILSQKGKGEEVIKTVATITRLNPTDVMLRIDLGEMLERVGAKQQAIDQYRAAIRFNELLPADEPKRLSPEGEMDIRRRLSALGG